MVQQRVERQRNVQGRIKGHMRVHLAALPNLLITVCLTGALQCPEMSAGNSGNPHPPQ